MEHPTQGQTPLPLTAPPPAAGTGWAPGCRALEPMRGWEMLGLQQHPIGFDSDSGGCFHCLTHRGPLVLCVLRIETQSRKGHRGICSPKHPWEWSPFSLPLPSPFPPPFSSLSLYPSLLPTLFPSPSLSLSTPLPPDLSPQRSHPSTCWGQGRPGHLPSPVTLPARLPHRFCSPRAMGAAAGSAGQWMWVTISVYT